MDGNGSHVYDPDSEPGELFYPDFYQEGPDAGRFIESPNAWGHTLRLHPEDDVATIELFGVTDSAIDNLPELDMRLITLVDIDGVSLEQAAARPRRQEGASGKSAQSRSDPCPRWHRQLPADLRSRMTLVNGHTSA